MNSANRRHLAVLAQKLCLGIGLTAAASCAVQETPNSKKIASAAQASSEETDASIDSGPAPLGAGMPSVPIHRADAGLNAHADATPMATQAMAAAAMGGSTLDGGEVDADVHEPLDAGRTLPPSVAPPPQPIHRYSFSGTGTNVPDEQGGKDAVIKGDAKLDGQDVVDFNGMGDGLVELPEDTFAQLTDFSVLVWLYAFSDVCWQRAFDLTSVQQVTTNQGGNGGPPNMPNMPITRTLLTSLYLTPYGCPDALPTLGYVSSTSKYHLVGKEPVAQDAEVLLGLSFSARSQSLQLIVNGVVKSEQPVPVDVRVLQHARAWLGHSATPGDPPLDGSIDELRVYASALASSDLAQIYARGPDAL